MAKEEKQETPIQPRDFDQDEINEINQYITANVPYSVLQTTLPITDNPIQKARVFTIVYRFINGAKNYAQNEPTKKKLLKLLEDTREIYDEVFNLLTEIENSTRNFGSHSMNQSLLDVYKDFDKNIMINNFIDVFLVFAEKQVLINMEDVTGFNLETEEGQEAYKKLTGEKEE